MNCPIRTIVVRRDVDSTRRIQAEEMRRRWTRQGTLVVNLVSSPGAGKTTLLERTAEHFRGCAYIGVLVGDLETDRDAQRLSPLFPTVQLTTGGACHLDPTLVERGVAALGLSCPDYLFIENVGNLVCPATHDLGEHLRVVLLSTPEGDDKPAKYPKIFRTSRLLLITKMDLISYVSFSVNKAIADARDIQPTLDCICISAKTGQGISEWCAYLEHARQRLLELSGGSILENTMLPNQGGIV